MACVGIGFNVKMAAAFGIVPACCLAYLLARPRQWALRLVHIASAGIVALIVGFSWFTTFDLVPADERPYAGSTTDNSMMQMVFVQYGVDRFIPHPWHRQRGSAVAQRAANSGAASPAASGLAADRVPIGPLRLADPHLGGQVGWFFPLAALGVAAFTVGRRRNQLLETPDIVLWTALDAKCASRRRSAPYVS
jgi:4-amino-4-deoxy-L-arabinose transferase-like glycosyltransferase